MNEIKVEINDKSIDDLIEKVLKLVCLLEQANLLISELRES